MKYLVLALCLASLNGCHHTEAEPSVDLGTPRQLIYVADDIGAPKHGGGSTAQGLIRVFEADTFAPVGSFDGGGGVEEVHATPDGSILWIVASSEGTVSLFDTTTYETTELDVGVSPSHSFITPAHDEIWVENTGSSDVSIISIAARAVVATVVTGTGHHKIAMVPGPSGLDSAYVSNITDGTITPVGGDRVKRVNVVGVGQAPHGMDYSFVTRRVYSCTGSASNEIDVVATTDEVGTTANDRDSIVARIALPSRCSFLRVSEDGNFAFATLPGSNQLARVRLSDHDVDLFVTDVDPDQFEIVGNTAYVAHGLSATVSVIDLTATGASLTIPVGNAVSPTATGGGRTLRYHQNRLFVPNAYDGTVSVIDTTTNAVVATLDGMHAPVSVAIAGPGFGTTFPR